MSNKKCQLGHISFKPYESVVPCDAVSPQAKPGAKAGNPCVDKINEELREEGLINKLKALQGILRAEMPYIRQGIEKIITNHINSKKQIENLLDALLDMLPLGYGKREFKRLNDYYFTISKINSRAYGRFYEQAVRE